MDLAPDEYHLPSRDEVVEIIKKMRSRLEGIQDPPSEAPEDTWTFSGKSIVSFISAKTHAKSPTAALWLGQQLLNRHFIASDKPGFQLKAKDEQLQFKFSGLHQSFDALIQSFKKGIQLKDRTSFGNTTRQCFTGTEVVDWLLANGTGLGLRSRAQASDLAQKMLNRNIIGRPSGEMEFEDKGTLFQLRDPDENGFTMPISGGDYLYMRLWKAQNPKGLVFFLHGLGEHCHRFENTILKLVGANMSVFAYDQRGHGFSSGKRGHAQTFQTFVDDLKWMLAHIPGKFEEIKHLPMFLWLHGWGCHVGMTLALADNALPIKGIVVTAGLIDPGVPVAAGKKAFGKLFSHIAPGVPVKNDINPKETSKSAQAIAKFTTDPYLHGMVTLTIGATLLDTGARLIRDAPNLKYPVCLVHGEQDRICNVESWKLFVKALGAQDKTDKLWPDLWHDVHNEPEADQVVQFIVDWLLPRMSKA